MLQGTAILFITLVLGTATAAADTPQAPGAADKELKEILALYVGSYRSRPDQGARGGRPIFLRVVAVGPPPGHTHALYAEMRHDSADGELYRQNLLLFDENPARSGNSATSLSFPDREAAASLVRQPDLVATGRLSTVPSLGPGCDMRFTREGSGYLGRIDPATCVITGKRGDTRRIEAQTLLRKDAVETLERGYSADGKLLFGNPDEVRYVWPRIGAGGGD